MTAICETCSLNMADPEATSCLTVGGPGHLAQHAYGSELWVPEPYKPRCPDCNVATGGTHHPGCTLEECCHGQRFGCMECFERLTGWGGADERDASYRAEADLDENRV